MWKQSENIVRRLFSREVCRAAPNTHIHRVRQLYENIVPNHTVYDIECPDHSFRKFTNDGQYLICFSRNYQELVVYRFNWLNYCTKGSDPDVREGLPPKAKKFDSYFIQLYSLCLGSATEVICKDFFLATDNSSFGIFATTTGADNDPQATSGAVPGVPSIERITVHLVRLADGVVVDERVYHDDFIHLTHNAGVFMYDDLLAILSIRYQSIHILQVRETGMFVDVHTIGTFCREDDELIINSQAQEEILFETHQAARKVKFLSSERGFSLPSKLREIKGKALVAYGGTESALERGIRGNQRGVNRGLNFVRNVAYHDQSNMIQEGNHVAYHDQSNMIQEGNHGENVSADIDIQYDGYFRGLFGGFEMSDLSQNDNHAKNCNEETSGHFKTSFSQTRLEAPGILHFNQRMEAPSADNQAGSVSTFDRHGLGIHIGTSWRSIPDYDSAVNGYEMNSRFGGEGGNLRSGEETGVSFSLGSMNMASSSSHGSENGTTFMDISVSAVSTSYSEHGGVLANPHLSDGNIIQYIVSSRSSGSLQQHGSVEEAMSSGSLPVAVSSSTGHDRFVNLSALQRRIGEAPARPYVEGAEETRSAFGVEAADRSMILSDLDVMGGLHLSIDPAIDMVNTTPAFILNARQQTDTPQPQSRSHQAEENISSLSARGEHTGERVIQEPDRQGNQLLGGIKQRLLSFLFQSIWNQDVNPVIKVQQLKRFYYHFQHYVDLVMWKVQFLDRYHLLIKFGSVDSVVSRNSDTSHQTAFLAIYNMETTEMLEFQQNSSEVFLQPFENFCDHFRAVPRYPLLMSYITSHSNNIFSREQLRKQKTTYGNRKSGSSAQVVKMTLASLPFSSQSQSPSAYFDQSLFHFDEKLISATDRHKPCMENPIKFLSRRRPNTLKFKINPGLELGSSDGRVKRVASFLFHPILPFVISIQQSFMQPSIINFHFRE